MRRALFTIHMHGHRGRGIYNTHAWTQGEGIYNTHAWAQGEGIYNTHAWAQGEPGRSFTLC